MQGAFLEATVAGSITLMIREYILTSKYMTTGCLKGGGVHVVQAFFSHDISEEIQIKGAGS